MDYGLIGERLTHSFSAEIHRRIAPYDYRAVELSPEALADFMKKRDFKGINVTIPYKREVMKYLDVTDPRALDIGAVNTVVNRDGVLYGYNTDLDGLCALMLRVAHSLEGKHVLILGTGGTSHTATCCARLLNAASVTVAGRRGGNGCISYETAYEKCRDTDVIVNTTPCGMFPNAGGGEGIAECAVDVSRFPRLSALADAVYNPLRTSLVLNARELGAESEGGLYMLVAQAVRASELFTASTYDDSLTERIFTCLSREKENTVLIGMPGSGKSTLGRAIAERTGRCFIDIDRMTEERLGMSISDIFDKYGEEHFRREETLSVRAAADMTGVVIATGGGVVTRRENIFALRRNGRIFFLDRPIDDITPTADRPTALDRDALRRRFAERESLYRTSADLTIPVRDGIQRTLERILEKL